jgi:hypothetical protein
LRVCTPDSRVWEIDGPSGRRYNFRKGIAQVTNKDARAIVAEGGFIPSMAGTTRAGLGYQCRNCGFGSYFRRCSRCNTEN